MFLKHLLTVSAVFIAIFLMVATINTQPILSPKSVSAALPPPGQGPKCPTGFSFNYITGQCEASACPEDTNYDASTNKCVDGPACPTDYTLQDNQCTRITSSTPLCPAGQPYLGGVNDNSAFCGVQVEISPGVFITEPNLTTCPDGTTINGITGQCDTTITTVNQCTSLGYTATGTGQGTCTVSPSCPSGSRLSGGVCQTNPIPKGPKPR